MVELMVVSRRTQTNGYFLELLHLVPLSLQWGIEAPRLCRRPSNTSGSFVSVSCGVTAPFPWVLVGRRFCVCSSRVESLSPSPVKVLQSNLTGLQSQIPLGLLVLLLDPKAGKPDVGLRTFTTVGELLWYNCSQVCGLPTWQVWGLILSWLCPSYRLTETSLTLDMEYIFWWVTASSCEWLFCS